MGHSRIYMHKTLGCYGKLLLLGNHLAQQQFNNTNRFLGPNILGVGMVRIFLDAILMLICAWFYNSLYLQGKMVAMATKNLKFECPIEPI